MGIWIFPILERVFVFLSFKDVSYFYTKLSVSITYKKAAIGPQSGRQVNSRRRVVYIGYFIYYIHGNDNSIVRDLQRMWKYVHTHI